MGIKDYLPDFKESLTSFYEESLKGALENKSSEYKNLLEKHLNHWYRTQKILIAIMLAIFLLLLIAYFWQDYPIPKYITLGIIIGLLGYYIRKNYDDNLTSELLFNYDSEEEDNK